MHARVLNVGSNPVRGFKVLDFWRVWMGLYFSFGGRTWKSLKFSFSRFGSGFGLFLAEQVRSLVFFEGFEIVQISTCQVRSRSKFIMFGFISPILM